MPCDPNSNNIIPPVGEPFPGLNLAPIQIPFPSIDIPTDLLEDLLDLVNSLGLLFPSGKFTPNIDNFTKDLFDLISNLLSQIAPFLSFYNFIMALFRLILCIIEVLCAIPNPFKIATAMVKLFTECLPPFLNLFPWLALIAMIIALILLIIALIEYIIATIIALIEEIIRNILILVKGVSFSDASSTLSAIAKIAELTCLIQNILAILVALAAIIAIIQSLAMFPGAPVCDDETPGGCCSPDVCPPFIKNSPWTNNQGKLLYNPQVGVDLAEVFASIDPPLSEDMLAIFAASMNPPRRERWQLVDNSGNAPYQFKDIITPIIDFSTFPPIPATFWPEGMTYASDTPSSKAPYNVDLRFKIDPAQFNSADTDGERYMRVNGCFTVRKPRVFAEAYNTPASFPGSLAISDLSNGENGTLFLEGGLVFEDDGETAYEINGEQATLNTFIHQADVLGTSIPNDTVEISDIEYTFNPQYGVLMGNQLITAGCLPEVAAEKAVMNAVIIAEDVRAVVDKLDPVPIGSSVKALPSLGVLPNVQGAQDCVVASLAVFKNTLTIEGAALFQADVEACLGDLKEQALAVICGAVAAGSSQFKSEMSLDTDIQFTSRPIVVTVQLKDAAGTPIAGRLPDECQPVIEGKMIGEVTLGEITDFDYNPGTGLFNASITSKVAGPGKVTVTFNGKSLSHLVAATDTANTQIEETFLPYEFIDAPDDTAIRRDQTDVSAGAEG